MCLPGAHSQEIVPLINNHFSVIYRPGDYADRHITFGILLCPPCGDRTDSPIVAHERLKRQLKWVPSAWVTLSLRGSQIRRPGPPGWGWAWG
jgi:hypothetical protein